MGLCPMARLFFENYFFSRLNVVIEFFKYRLLFRILSKVNSINDGREHEGVDVSGGLHLGDCQQGAWALSQPPPLAF